jgi:hypothetical protein
VAGGLGFLVGYQVGRPEPQAVRLETPRAASSQRMGMRPVAPRMQPARNPVPVENPVGGDFPQFLSFGPCQVSKEGKVIVLTGPGAEDGRIMTANRHEPPFALRVNAETDSRNLRLYYGHDGELIFNWEGNEDELRIHDPATGEQQGVPNQGRIEPDKYHDVVWEMYANGMRVLVDGKERARRRGHYERLEAALGVGPAFGSVVTIQSFRVEPLEGKRLE